MCMIILSHPVVKMQFIPSVYKFVRLLERGQILLKATSSNTLKIVPDQNGPSKIRPGHPLPSPCLSKSSSDKFCFENGKIIQDNRKWFSIIQNCKSS